MERGSRVNWFGGDITAAVRASGAKEGVASVTAETAPHGPPSHSAVMATHESNAMPTGPRITQAASTTKISQRERASTMALMVTRGAGVACPHRREPAGTSSGGRMERAGAGRAEWAVRRAAE